eukprot:g4069.t1
MRKSIRRLVILSLALALPSLAEPAATTNIVVFDASGSMWNKMEDSTRIEIAREVMSQFLEGYDTAQPLGVIAYGHRKRGDCEDIEILLSPGTIDPSAVSRQINSLLPRGKTPLAESLLRAGRLIPANSEDANILLITDGLETCGGDPCAVAKELIAEGIKVRAHVVGFGLTKAEADSLACIAHLTGGQIFNPSNGDELLDALKQSVAAAEEPAPAPEPAGEKLFDVTVTLRDTGFGLPAGFMKWTATGEAGITRDLGSHEGHQLSTALPPGTWSLSAEGPEGSGAGNVVITGPARPYIDFTAAQVDAEILNDSPLTAGVSAYIRFRINMPPPGNSQSHFMLGIFPLDDPLEKIVSSGQNRFVFAGKKIAPGEYNAAVIMPKAPGRYKLAFLRRGTKAAVLAEKPVEVVAVPELRITVPPRIVAGSVFSPVIISGGAEFDRLRLFALNADGSRGKQLSEVKYSTHIQQNEGLIDAPAAPGEYQLVLAARTADPKVSPEASALVKVVGAEEFGTSPAPAEASDEDRGKTGTEKIPVSLMLDGDAEQDATRELLWTVRPVKKSPGGAWIYDQAHPNPMGESRMLANPEIRWDLEPGFWEVSVLVGDNRINRVLVEIDPAAGEHAFPVPAEKLPKPAHGQPTQWLISAEGGEPEHTAPAAPAAPVDPKAKTEVILTLPGLPDDAAVTWSANPLEADGTTLSRDGRMGGGGNGTGSSRTLSLAPGKWKLSARSGEVEYLLVADVVPGKAGQTFTLDRRFGSADVTLDVAEKIDHITGGFFPITLAVPAGFRGRVALHTEAERDGKALFEMDAAELAGATDQVLPMPEKPGNYELQIKDSTGAMLLGLPFELSGTPAPPAGKADDKSPPSGKEPVLRDFGGGLYGTGTLLAEIAGRSHEFATTRQKLKTPAGMTENAGAQGFLDFMQGKTIDTAALRLLAGNLYVSLDAYGAIGDSGPDMQGEKRTGLQVNFALDPKSLEPRKATRELIYSPPGSSTMEKLKTDDFELGIDSTSVNADGSLALKGSFSATLTRNLRGEALDKPLPVKGTFDIHSASGDESIADLLLKH